jgi:hypothetical protein
MSLQLLVILCKLHIQGLLLTHTHAHFAITASQERGNVPFVQDGGFGVYERRPAGIGRAVSALLQETAILHDMGLRAKAAGRSQATLEIARDVVRSLLPLAPAPR